MQLSAFYSQLFGHSGTPQTVPHFHKIGDRSDRGASIADSNEFASNLQDTSLKSFFILCRLVLLAYAIMPTASLPPEIITNIIRAFVRQNDVCSGMGLRYVNSAFLVKKLNRKG